MSKKLELSKALLKSYWFSAKHSAKKLILFLLRNLPISSKNFYEFTLDWVAVSQQGQKKRGGRRDKPTKDISITCRVLCYLIAGAAIALCMTPSPITMASVVSRPAPPGIPTTNDYNVIAGGKSVAVYDLVKPAFPDNAHGTTPNTRKPLMGVFEMTAPTVVKVQLSTGKPLASVRIRPKSANITPMIRGNTFQFTIPRPMNLDIEVNGIKRPLFLFANPPYKEPQPGPGVTILKSGEVRTTNINLDGKTNQTVYLANGSVLKGSIFANNASNLRIYGSGLVTSDGSTGNRLWLRNVNNVTFDGPIFVNNINEWTAHVINGSGLNFKNVKILSSLRDGLDIDSCDNTTVDGMFVYSFDDSLDIKSVGWMSKENGPDGRDIKNIRILNSTVWQAGNGNPLKIDELQNKITVSNILWENIDVLHREMWDKKENNDVLDPENGTVKNPTTSSTDAAVSPWTTGSMVIWTVDAHVDGVTYRNIRVEDMQVRGRGKSHFLIDLRTSQPNWEKLGNGYIKNILFDNVQYLGGNLPASALVGHQDRSVSDIRFQSLKHKNKLLSSQKVANLQTNAYTSNIHFGSIQDGK